MENTDNESLIEEIPKPLPYQAYRRPPPTPLAQFIQEARLLAEAQGYESIKSQIGRLNLHTDPARFTERAGQLRQDIEDELSGTTNDLEARLVKQARSLDGLYDFFVQLSQYTLAEGMRECLIDLQNPVNLALKSQNQCMRTIDKFKKLQEKRFKNAERKEGIGNEKKD